jgi:undecaprenyl-phosphate galactose phosphotransferase
MPNAQYTVNAVTSDFLLPVPARRGLYPDLLKRGFDIVLSVSALGFFLPVMALIYFLVRLDGGPGLFAHRRVGRGGREFRCLKFRSMVVDAEPALSSYLDAHPSARVEWEKTRKLKNDPRITRLGKLLRKTSADELPQLFNVIMGDMSIVGPRPVTLSELEKYGRNSAAYLSVRPGITGLWQVSGRNDASYESRVALDSEYCGTVSLGLDVALLIKTFFVVLKREGAY